MERDRSDDLAAFLAEAHRNGYATVEPESGEEPFEKRITYDRGDWHYRDVYAGSDAFVGHEIVALDGEPIWGMHYDGRITAAAADSAATYDFLRRALAAVTPERPHRGPERFEDESWVYEFDVDGTLDRFDGEERITRDGTAVYRGTVAGGRIE